MIVATLPKLYSTSDAAKMLGITDGRVRQILRQLEEEHRPVGSRAGRSWVLTDDDIASIRNLPDNRFREFRKI